MDNKLKGLLLFAAGVGVGVLIANVYFRKQYEEIANEEIDAMQEYKKGRRDSDTCIPYSESEMVNDDKVLVLPEKKYTNLVKNYNAFSKTENRPPKSEFNPNLPYVISIEEFSEEKEDFDKLTIYYYSIDDTLADEDEEIMADTVLTVGECLKEFQKQKDGDEILYIRNEKLKVDYEVIYIEKSYSETILGEV